MVDSKIAGQAGAASQATIDFQDAALVQKCCRGDMQAFGVLVAKYQDRVMNLMHRLCGSASDAEELAQEAFLKAMQSIKLFRQQSQFYTWLFRIAANLAISHRRRAGRMKVQSLGNDDGDGAVGLQASQLRDMREAAPQRAAMDAEVRRRIERCLDELDEEFRVVVVLRDVEDMDYSQIAQVLELPVGTIKSRLHRARLILKDKLADLVKEA